MATENEEMAAKVSQSGPTTDPRDVYDTAHGRYDDANVTTGRKRSLTQAPSTVSPLKMSGG
jgi:hypothetical protein